MYLMDMDGNRNTGGTQVLLRGFEGNPNGGHEEKQRDVISVRGLLCYGHGERTPREDHEYSEGKGKEGKREVVERLREKRNKAKEEVGKKAPTIVQRPWVKRSKQMSH